MLEFEKSIQEIKNKIDSLKDAQSKNDVDLSDEIDMLEATLQTEKEKFIHR